MLSRRTARSGESAVFGGSVEHSGTDFVFSAPKSVSIIWALSDAETRTKLTRCQHSAVLTAVNLLRRHAIRERCGKGGRLLRPANAAFAAFTHFRSRRALHELPEEVAEGLDLEFSDPSLHTHVVVPDLVAAKPRPAVGTDKQEVSRLKIAYTALYGRWSMALGAWYHAQLAMELNQLGFLIEPTGDNGLFQIAGVEPRWNSAFSARSAGRPNLKPETPRLSRKSRNAKAKQTPDDSASLTETWIAFAERIGINRNALLAKVRTGARSEPRLTREQRELLIETALAEISRNEAVLQEQDLHRGVAAALVSLRLFARPTDALVDAVKASKNLVPLRPTESYGLPQWTTRSNQSDEKEVQDRAAGLFHARLPAGELQPVFSASDPFWTEGQRTAIAGGCAAGRLCVIAGPPGVGKTASLGPIIAAFQAEYGAESVVGAAESWQSALNLRKVFGIESFALASLLVQAPHQPGTMRQRKLIIVDEAGLLSTLRMKHVLELALNAGAKLILLGDLEQLNPIEAGSGLRLVKEELTAIELTEIVRQRDPEQKALVTSLVAVVTDERQQRSHPEDAPPDPIDAMAKQLTRTAAWQSHATSEAAIAEVVDRLQAASLDDGRTTIALARSHAEAHHITRAMRKRLRERKQIEGDDVILRAVTPMGHPFQLRLAKNDRIRFQMRHHEVGVINGTTATVTAIKGTGANLTITATIDGHPGKTPLGESVTFKPSLFADETGRVRMAAAYVMTIYGAQGLTVDEAVILRSNRISFRELYVAATRARESFAVIDVKPSRAKLEAPIVKSASRKISSAT